MWKNVFQCSHHLFYNTNFHDSLIISYHQQIRDDFFCTWLIKVRTIFFCMSFYKCIINIILSEKIQGTHTHINDTIWQKKHSIPCLSIHKLKILLWNWYCRINIRFFSFFFKVFTYRTTSISLHKMCASQIYVFIT